MLSNLSFNKMLLVITDPIGRIIPPTDIPLFSTPAISDDGKLTGVIGLLNNILRLVFVVAGLYAFINIIIAGFQFMNASGDPKKVQMAWTKIWQTFVGLLIMVLSFLLAAVIGMLLFGNPMAILAPDLTFK